MQSFQKFTIALVCALLLSTAAFGAEAKQKTADTSKQDFATALESAKKAFDTGEFVQATDNLKQAIEVISKLRAEEAKKYFPDAPAGFTAEYMEAPPLPPMFSKPLGTTVRKVFTREKDGAKVLVVFNFDDPGLGQIFEMVKNTQGAATTEVNGMPAVKNDTDKVKDFKIQVSPRMMVTVQTMDAAKVDINTVQKIAESVNYQALKKLF